MLSLQVNQHLTSNQNLIHAQEVAQHWIVIFGKVYEVTKN